MGYIKNCMEIGLLYCSIHWWNWDGNEIHFMSIQFQLHDAPRQFTCCCQSQNVSSGTYSSLQYSIGVQVHHIYELTFLCHLYRLHRHPWCRLSLRSFRAKGNLHTLELGTLLTRQTLFDALPLRNTGHCYTELNKFIEYKISASNFISCCAGDSKYTQYITGVKFFHEDEK